MGLTIHYRLTTSLTEAKDIRTVVEALRECAQDLPFTEVGDLVEFQGDDADFQRSGKEDELRWFKVQAGQYVENDGHYFGVTPTHVIGFSTWPGEGCEEANFGFCRYPAYVPCPTRSGLSRSRATHLDGWRWGSFCKTQYASHPDCGGLENFLRCHLCVVRLLDFAKSTALIALEVRDEGGYWDHRDLEKLGREVGNWNEFIAAYLGSIKNAAQVHGVSADSIITGFPNFEHLEAKGLERLAKLRNPESPNQTHLCH